MWGVCKGWPVGFESYRRCPECHGVGEDVSVRRAVCPTAFPFKAFTHPPPAQPTRGYRRSEVFASFWHQDHPTWVPRLAVASRVTRSLAQWTERPARRTDLPRVASRGGTRAIRRVAHLLVPLRSAICRIGPSPAMRFLARLEAHRVPTRPKPKAPPSEGGGAGKTDPNRTITWRPGFPGAPSRWRQGRPSEPSHPRSRRSDFPGSPSSTRCTSACCRSPW